MSDARPNSNQLALIGIRPNPVKLAALIEYSLGSWSPARIELVDVAGRSVLKRDLGSPGPGRHTLMLRPDAGTRTGMYIVRLTQAGDSVSSKMVLRH